MSVNKDQTMMFGFCEAQLKEEKSRYDYNSEDEINRLVIDSADSDSDQRLSEDEEEFTIPENEDEDTSYTGRDNTTVWYSNPDKANITKKDIKPIISGAKPNAQKAKTELDCWNLFFTEDIMEEILRHTNVEINSKPVPETPNTRAYIIKETSMDELMAVLGLMYIAGLNNSTGYNLTDLWRSDGTGVDIFRMTMSLQRFNFLQTCLRFDDATTREARNSVDNIAPIRSMFEKFVENCKDAYSPSQCLCLDAKYIPFRGECHFRQFMKQSTAAYGIKMFALVDTKVNYTVNLEIHAGNQPDGPHATSYEPSDVVDRLVKPVSKSNRNVTFDNQFTSVPLATHLLNVHGLTCTGALMKTYKEIPRCFVKMEGRGVFSSRFGFQKDLTLVSYIPKKSKVVVLLSSYHHDKTIDTRYNEKPKPEIVSFYNSTKTGVEFVDKLTKMYDVRNYCKSWPILILYTMMNIAAINSFIIYRENNKNTKLRRCEFIRKLGLALLEQHLKIRKNKSNLPRELKKRIFEQVGESDYDPPGPSEGKYPYKRCRDCPSAKDRKTKYKCIECKKPICLEHVVTMCQSCTAHTME
nr:piggyBac transposable element-derived protein 4-like [Helicoverpa armigera]